MSCNHSNRAQLQRGKQLEEKTVCTELHKIHVLRCAVRDTLPKKQLNPHTQP